MRTDHAHPVAVDRWSVERTVAQLIDEAAAMRRFMFRVACVAVGALGVALLALCLAIG